MIAGPLRSMVVAPRGLLKPSRPIPRSAKRRTPASTSASTRVTPRRPPERRGAGRRIAAMRLLEEGAVAIRALQRPAQAHDSLIPLRVRRRLGAGDLRVQG